MVNAGEVSERIVKLLNDSSKMEDPLGAERSGSFCLKPEQELSSNRMMPKLQLTYDNQDGPTERSFGRLISHNKTYDFNIWIFVKRNQTYKGYKNTTLVKYLEEQIEKAIIKNQNDIGIVHLSGFGEVMEPNENKEMNIWYGVKPLMFEYRQSYK